MRPEAPAGGSEPPEQPDAAPSIGTALRGGAVYAIAAAIQRGIIFVLLPIYTRVLDPVAYGRLSVLLAIAAVAIIILSCGMDTAFFRAYFLLRDEPENQARFVTTSWVFLLVAPPAAALVASALGAVIFASSGLIQPLELALALAGAALFVSATVIPLSLFRAEYRLRDYVILTAVTGGGTAALTLLFVVGFRWGVAGWLLGVLVANGLTLLVAARLVPLRFSSGGDRGLLRGPLKLGLPLIPHLLSQWGLGVSNRLVLAGIVSAGMVGVYALAANIALPVAIAMQSMATAFFPSYARASNEESAQDALGRVMLAEFLVTLVVAAVGTLLGPIAVRYLAPAQYAGAAEIVPWITAGYALYGFYFLPMNVVALTVGRTGKVWVVTVTAAVANLGSLLILVPAVGLVGAGVAVTIGYLVLLVGLLIYSRGPDNPVRYEWGRFGRAIFVFVLVYALAVVTSGNQTIVDALIRLAWLGAAVPLLVAVRVVRKEQLTAILQGLSWPGRLAGRAS